jgi:hypothetical protein
MRRDDRGGNRRDRERGDRGDRGQRNVQWASGAGSVTSPSSSAASKLNLAFAELATTLIQAAVPIGEDGRPLPELHRAEQRYVRAGHLVEGEQKQLRGMTSLLNKLTPENFEKIVRLMLPVCCCSV